MNNVIKTTKDKTEDVLHYISGGLLGDFINGLYIIHKNFELTNKKGVLTLCNLKNANFRFPLVHTYSDLYNIIISQEYIDDFIYDTQITSFDQIDSSKYINLSTWYTSRLLYKTDWINIFTNHYNLNGINTNFPWLKHKTKDERFKDVVFIHQNKGVENTFISNLIKKNNCIFLTCNINEYHNSPYKNITTSCHVCENLFELCTMINSCKFFIGSQSSPLAIAYAMGKECLGEFLGGDAVHYINMENYNKNFYWFYNNTVSPNYNTITNYIDI